ncbi:MAG TPA: hypothetical protein VLU25_02430 [Acidobacteriota bacterium]|nr:hypothetical protein [Acidobacteriota bacterium]
MNPARVSPSPAHARPTVRPAGDSNLRGRPNLSNGTVFTFRDPNGESRSEITDIPILRPTPDGDRRPALNPNLPTGNTPSEGDEGAGNGDANSGNGWINGDNHSWHRPQPYYPSGFYWVYFYDPATGLYWRYPASALGRTNFCYDRLSYFIDFYNPYLWHYHHGSHISRCSQFISGLTRYNWGRYGAIADAALARYALGDTVLSGDVVNLALAEADQLAASLASQVRVLQDSLAEYEAGNITRDEFRETFKRGLSYILENSKEISDDYQLGFIDPREDMDVEKFDKARDIEDFRLLLADLVLKVNELQSQLDQLRNRDDFRTISVEEYQEPSAPELAREVEKVAKALKKSYKKI